jgi:serine/threonine protein kinase
MPEKTLIAGRYRLSDELGSGGEARVFRAHDVQEGREVAVRLPVRPEPPVDRPGAPEFHPGWVRLLGAGFDPDQGAYQVFELLEGETLRRKVESAPLGEEAWRSFVGQSLDAVGALHDAGWVHGDLNGENFLQTGAGWKLLELPFLRLGGHHSVAFGSIHTLAPEQLQGHAPDDRSDLYALGCLYYYAAAGEYPHPGASRQEVAISLLRFPPTPLEEKATGLPARLAEWTMGLLKVEAAKRCPSVAAARRLLAIA